MENKTKKFKDFIEKIEWKAEYILSTDEIQKKLIIFFPPKEFAQYKEKYFEGIECVAEDIAIAIRGIEEVRSGRDHDLLDVERYFTSAYQKIKKHMPSEEQASILLEDLSDYNNVYSQLEALIIY